MSLSPPLSAKQLKALGNLNKRINILCGAVRSGKTHLARLATALLLRDAPPGDAMIIGKTRESIQRNVIEDLCKLFGTKPVSTKANECRFFGRKTWIVGANDEKAVSRIQGSTLSFAFCDEIAVLPEPFVKMLLSRLSVAGAKLIATCNPEGPHHWLKTEYIDKADYLDLNYWKFELDDNPSLDESYKEAIKREYTGHWYARYILGEWAVAEGLVFDAFSEEHNLFERSQQNPDYYIAGIDYGITNPTAAVLIGVSPRTWPQLCVHSEYYYNSKEQSRAKTDSELADDLQSFFAATPPRAIYVDPSASSLKLELRYRDLPVVDADNDVLKGIKIVNKFFAQQNLLVNKNCSNLQKEILTYSWDPKAASRGEDKPIKDNDHCCDALRYSVASAFKSGEIWHPNDDLTIEQVRAQAYGSSPMDSLFSYGAGYR